MKNIISSIWKYVILVASVVMIVAQSIYLYSHLIISDWNSVLIDVVIISLFAYIIWNRFFRTKQIYEKKS